MAKVAVVTGSNKGIGYAIVRALCKQFKGDVYLTSRDAKRGEDAVKQLQGEGLNPKYHQLDICDKTSISKLRQFLEETYGGLDILVNNAGIAYKAKDPAPFSEQAEVTMKTNYTGLLDVCDALFPILKTSARVVHLSSMVSTWVMKNATKDRLEKIKSLDTIEEVTAMMAEFVSAAQNGKHKDLGWIDSAYGTTKVGVTVVTPIQQRQFDKEKPNSDIIVNSCCPGYVATDMSSHKGNLTIDQGAQTPVYLALLPPNTADPRGKFLQKKIVYEWQKGQYP